MPCRQVKDDSRALTLGALTLPLSRLLTASELTLDQWFQLSSAGPNSRLYMKLVMRVWHWRKRWGLGDMWTLGIQILEEELPFAGTSKSAALTGGRNELSPCSVLGLHLHRSSSAGCLRCAITLCFLYCRSYT